MDLDEELKQLEQRMDALESEVSVALKKLRAQQNEP